MAFLALDPSKRSTGWAMWAPGWNTARYGHWCLGSEMTSDGRTFAKLTRCLKDIFFIQPFEYLYYERPINPDHLRGHTNINTIMVLAGIRGEIERFGYAKRLRIVKAVGINDWRPQFIGRIEDSEAKSKARRLKKAGDKRASATRELKSLTMRRARQYEFTPKCEDEADALGILDYALAINGVTPPWRGDEVLRAILTEASR